MSKEIQKFNNNQFGELEILIVDGIEYFPATDSAKILGYTNPQKAIRDHCKGVNEMVTPTKGGKQKKNYITEGNLYRLIINSKLPQAEKFESWVFDEVLPQIRKTGSYANNQNSINEFKGQLTTMVNNLFEDKLKEVKEYYKINSKSKFDLSSYIKKRLGILRADDEYEQVKARVFLLLNINKWEDLNVENYKDVLPVIDESIRIIKLDRPQQTNFWD
ncbi:BRO-N domain-containing protein [Clostridium butyricum]